MIYLRYAYEKSGIGKATRIGLQIDDPGPTQTDVVEEFSAAFPWANVEKANSLDSVFDLYIYTSLKTLRPLRQITWAIQNRSQAKLALGFFSISDRTLVVVPHAHLYSYAIGNLLRTSFVAVFTFLLTIQTRIRKRR